MSAVGLSDLYRYGARFVGYGLVVIAAGGVFVVGGYVLGDTNIFTQVSNTEALLGIAAGAIGVLLALSGLVGLVYKLIADAVTAGTAAALRTEAADVGATAVAEPEADEQPDGADDTDESVPAGVSADDEPAADQPKSATAESVDLFEGVEESEATDPEQTDAEAPPQEWSPPDPSEFERTESAEPSTDAAPEETEPNAEATRTAADLFGDPEEEAPSDEQSDERLIDDDSDESPDKGAEGFDVASDSDPLSDALDDE